MRGSTTSTDPRVLRTQKHVLEQAWQLLVEEGPAGLTFSALATRAEVARQTLYRYWDSPEALVADLIRRRDLESYVVLGDARGTLRNFLVRLRDMLADPGAVAAYSLLIAGADHSAAAADALADVMTVRREWLNGQLRGLREPLDEEEFAGLSGPLIYRRLCARAEISDRLIERVLDTVEA